MVQPILETNKMKKSSIIKYLLIPTLIFGTPKYFSQGGTSTTNETKQEKLEQIIESEKEKQYWDSYYATTDSLIQNAPKKYISSEGKRLKDDCSNYVRRAGEEIFNKEYSWNDAWDRRNFEKIAYEFKSKKHDWEGKLAELDSLVMEGKIERGAILTFYNPKSYYNKKGRKETHVELFLGEDELGEFWTSGNRGLYQGASPLSELRRQGYDLRAILIENKELMTEIKEKYGQNDSS